MRTERRRTVRYLTLAAVICSTPVTYAQTASLNGADVLDNEVYANAPGDPQDTQVVAYDPVALPITDDGRKGDELQPTGQLVVAFAGREERALSVDILNEAGGALRHYDLVKVSGRSVVPISVMDLSSGRYVARISTGGGTRTVRFRRDQ